MVKVQPKKKIYHPKYPSYLDKSPLEYPETMPYPFTDKMVDFLAKAGFVGAMMLSPLVGNGQTQDSLALYNPFPESAMQLPFRFAMFGSGSPERLTSQEAIKVINHAFELEGLKMEKEKFLENDSCKIRVNAFNEQYKIGYIWLDWRNAGSDLCVRNNRMFSSKKNGKSYYQQFIDNSEAFFKNRLVLRKRIFPKFHKIKDNKKEDFFYKELYKYQIEQHLVNIKKRKDLSPNLKTWMLSLTDLFPNNIAANLYHQLNSLYPYLKESNIKALLEIEAGEILKERKKNRKKRSQSLVKLLRATSSDVLSKSPHYKRQFIKLFSYNWKERDLSIFDNSEDFLFLSKKEIQFLSSPKEYFIAPISYKDNRTILQDEFYFRNPFDFLSAEEKIEFKKIQKQFFSEKNKSIKDELKVLMKPYNTKINKLNNEARKKYIEETKLKTMQRLENDVRMYIQWAKAQQGY